MEPGTESQPAYSANRQVLRPQHDAHRPYVPIYYLAHHYYLYHAPTIAYLRSTLSLPGTLIGTLPQSAQQNVFLGLPLLLMPEEVAYLCGLGIAFIVDDTAAHRKGVKSLEWISRQERTEWTRTLLEAGAGVARGLERQKGLEREKALKTLGDGEIKKRVKRRAAERTGRPNAATLEDAPLSEMSTPQEVAGDAEAHSLLEDDVGNRPTSAAPLTSPTVDEPKQSSNNAAAPKVQPYTITPTTSHPPIPLPSPPSSPSSPPSSPSLKPPKTPSDPLHAHLTRLSYVLTPGLRFGCQYLAYPGDPLRFHSHFLVVGRAWDEEVELGTLVGLGRLGTGVKKGVCFGGAEDAVAEGAKSKSRAESPLHGQSEDDDRDVRCFTIEWGGM